MSLSVSKQIPRCSRNIIAKSKHIALSFLDLQAQSYFLVTERTRRPISLISLRVTCSLFVNHILHGHLFSVVTRLLAAVQRNLSSIPGRAHSVQTVAPNFCTQWFPNCFKFVERLDVVSFYAKQPEKQILGVFGAVIRPYVVTNPSGLCQQL
jgi:hypothetical protein